LQTVVETPAFLRDCRDLGLSDAERLAMAAWVGFNPDAGDVIEGSGGARKVRFAGKGKGKSGGYRIITFYSGKDVPVFLLNVCSKNEKTDLTPKERQVLKTILTGIVDVYRGKRKSQ
jgi:mRNA-degrading endonuclease RelE of RelBE toxin-antitoxin system